MKTCLFAQIAAVVTFGWLPFALEGAPSTLSPCDMLPGQTFALGTGRTRETQEFVSETRVVAFAPNGAPGVTDIDRLRLIAGTSSTTR